jgi:toxin ParE1/3/4
MAFRLTSRAQRDFETIGDYLAIRSPKAAADLAMRFLDSWDLLATQPHSGQVVNNMPGLRRFVMGEYIAFYRIEGRDIAIVRIFHGRRDLSREDFSG